MSKKKKSKIKKGARMLDKYVQGMLIKHPVIQNRIHQIEDAILSGTQSQIKGLVD